MVLLIGKVGRVTTENFRRLLSRKILKIATRLQKCDAGVDWQNVDVKRFSEHLGPVWSVAISPDGQTLARGGWYQQYLESAHREVALHTISHSGWMPLRLAPMGRPLLAAVRRQSSCGTCVLESHSKPFLVMQIQFGRSPSGPMQTLASSSSDKTIKLWNLRNGEVPNSFWSFGLVFSVAFSPDGQTLASASKDRTISCGISVMESFYVRSLVIQMLLELLPSVLMDRLLPAVVGTKQLKCGISIMESYYALYLDTQTWFLLSLSAPMGRP